tara:strand:+ start:1018 stop:2340 length:1323 start_codon:yes stop_codon:yes gene_type:complete
MYLGYIFIGALFYMNVEDFEPCDDANSSCPWGLLDSVYFAHVTMSTVGYGDLSPSTRGGQAFTLAYIFFGVVVVFSRLADLLTGVTKPIFDWTRATLEAKFPQEVIDIDGDGVADFKIPRHPLIYYGKALVGPLTLIIALQCSFAGVFCAVEDWSFWVAFYHCIVTATTVGYGDVSITTDEGKVVAIVQILFSVASISALITDVVDLHRQRVSLLRRAELLSAKLDPGLITSLDSDGSGVDKFEFVVGMLVKLVRRFRSSILRLDDPPAVPRLRPTCHSHVRAPTPTPTHAGAGDRLVGRGDAVHHAVQLARLGQLGPPHDRRPGGARRAGQRTGARRRGQDRLVLARQALEDGRRKEGREVVPRVSLHVELVWRLAARRRAARKAWQAYHRAHKSDPPAPGGQLRGVGGAARRMSHRLAPERPGLCRSGGVGSACRHPP